MGAQQYTLGGGQCKPGGKGGQLQKIGAAAAIGCLAPTGGLNFIDYNQITKGTNLPVGQDLPTTFGCMAAVGDKGCGFEQPLEAAYQALHNVPAANANFIRADAQLFVIFLTDEDDCSADNSCPQSDPSCIFNPASTSMYGSLLSYRCTQYGVSCNGALPPYGDSGGPLSGCKGATDAEGGKLTDVRKYIDFFTKPASQGGVKVDPTSVSLVAISAPSSPFSTFLANPNPMPPGPYVSCPTPMGTTCAVVLQHSCFANTEFFGDPAVRLNQVVNAVSSHQQTSVCDTSYQSALQSLGAKIVSQVGPGCLPAPLADPNNPDCVVEDVTAEADGTTTVRAIPKCGTATPCWKLESKDPTKCRLVCANDGDPGQHFGVTIDRGGAQPPPNTTARVSCTTQNHDLRAATPVCGAPL
jgi:hypothetical protein